jgi:hypothetical protein
MKLFTERVEDVKILQEEDDKGEKSFFIEGIFMQGDIKNRNGRMYPKEVLIKETARYNKEMVTKNRAFGELGHPSGPTINLERVSHKITNLKPDGPNIVGKAKIMETPYGTIVKNLMKENCELAVSSRGMGSLNNKNGVMQVQDDFHLATAADIVADPSAPDAFVKGIMEGVEWVNIDGSWKAQQVVEEILETGNRSVKELSEQKLRLFDKFLKSLIS